MDLSAQWLGKNQLPCIYYPTDLWIVVCLPHFPRYIQHLLPSPTEIPWSQARCRLTTRLRLPHGQRGQLQVHRQPA